LKSRTSKRVVIAAPGSSETKSWPFAPEVFSQTSALGTAGSVAVSRANTRSARLSALKSPVDTAVVGPVASVVSSVNVPPVFRYTAAPPSPFTRTSSGSASPNKFTSRAARASCGPTPAPGLNVAPEPVLSSTELMPELANTKSMNASPLTSPMATARLSTSASPSAVLAKVPPADTNTRAGAPLAAAGTMSRSPSRSRSAMATSVVSVSPPSA
jgi:hypothetical protein